MPKLPDVVLVVAKRHRIQVPLRRFAPHKAVKAIRGEHLVDRAQPVGAFGMSGGVACSRQAGWLSSSVVMQGPGA